MYFVRNEFQFPIPMSQALLNYFWQGKVPTPGQLKSHARALKTLWPLLAKGRGQQDVKHYSGETSLADAYGAYYLPANAMKLPLILEEAKLLGVPLTSCINERAPLRWMDVGCGPGTAFWGLAWWAHHRKIDFEYWGLEQSPQFLKLAESLAKTFWAELGGSKKLSAHWENFRKQPSGGKSLLDSLRRIKPHVVSMSNSIGEMSPDLNSRAEWVGEILDALKQLSSEDGVPRFVVLIEPGAKNATRELLELREKIRLQEGVEIFLPCLDSRPCGALVRPDDWCHEEASVCFPKWMDDLGAEAGLRKEAVLFSYLVLGVGCESSTGASIPRGGSRIVSQMMTEKGLVQCFLCTKDKLKTKARVLNSRVSPENEKFLQAVRGTIFSGIDLSEKGDVLRMNFVQESDELDPTVFPPLR